jgi:outer membrane protein TolC
MCNFRYINYISIFFLIGFSVDSFANELSLIEAEQIALERDYIIKKYSALSEGLKERAIADGQLPDPELSFGLAEVPLNNFNLNQHEDTEVRLGLSQAIPPGDTLKYRTERTNSMADVEYARMLNQRLLVLNNVRTSYIEMYFQKEKNQLLQLNRELFTEMADITESQYAEGRDNQHDVLRAQLELSLIEDKIEETKGLIDVAQAKLSEWIQPENASRPISSLLPQLSILPTQEVTIENARFHPLLAIENANVEAAQKSVAIAEEQYKPKWMIDFMVTENTASQFDLQTGPDFAGVFFKVSLPLFTDKRQDKVLSASKKNELAMRFNRSDRLRELNRQIDAEYANLNRLKRRLDLYKKRATIEAEQTQGATFSAYQNDLTDFETLVRSRILALNTQLDMLDIQSKYFKSHINLLYLSGETL